MKQQNEYRISELMNEYTDEEFCEKVNPSGCGGKSLSEITPKINPSAIGEKVMNELNQKENLKQRKPMRPLFKGMIAAAAAVVVFSTTAITTALAGRFFGSYRTLTNTIIEVSPSGEVGNVNVNIDHTLLGAPFEYREGRIIFTADGGETDITDIIDDETPYIYSYMNQDTGRVIHLIIGGDPGKTGYIELMNIGTEEEPEWVQSGLWGTANLNVYGVDLEFVGLTWQQYFSLGEAERARHAAATGQDVKGTLTYTGEQGKQRKVVSEWNSPEWFDKACRDLGIIDVGSSLNDLDLDVKMQGAGGSISGTEMSPLTFDCFCERYALDPAEAEKSPIEERNGRLFVNVNGEEKVITDLVSESEPFVEALDRPDGYDAEKPWEAYLIVGGVPGDYKYVKVFNRADGNLTSYDEVARFKFDAVGDKVYGYTLKVDGEEIEFEELVESVEQNADLEGRFECETYAEEWYTNACERFLIGSNVTYVEMR